MLRSSLLRMTKIRPAPHSERSSLSLPPNGPYKNGPGEISTPITIGGKVVNPGDIIVGDQDGIVIIKPEDAEELAKQTKQVMEKEISIMDKILNKGTYDRPWVDEKLVEIGCEYR